MNNKTNNQTEETPLEKIPMGPVEKKTPIEKMFNFFSTVFGYSNAGLKFIDLAARITVAAALYLKLNETLLNYAAGFLALTAIFEIFMAVVRAYGPNKK